MRGEFLVVIYYHELLMTCTVQCNDFATECKNTLLECQSVTEVDIFRISWCIMHSVSICSEAGNEQKQY